MLTLKDFVKDTLTEIVDALSEFSAERGDTGASANPPLPDGKDFPAAGILIGEYHSDTNRYDVIMPVAFDVAVTASDNASTKAGGGIKVVSLFKADGSIESGTNATSANRVQFTVPLRLPDTGDNGQPPRAAPRVITRARMRT
ncbi:hypothetical protein [Thalassospira profundimaris]|uniref:hypothetical protein n=1 Tax=Thalassospira profundimaris TaxID=502049 RepID=UPI0011BF5DB3|nr:hypothetical protein [Thalassospira profundimaris]